jgi:RNA polymerase sigma-70 factor (ECF subfamily)
VIQHNPRDTAPQYSLEHLAAVLERSQWELQGFLRGIVGDSEQARDLVQDTCYEACRAAQRGMPPFERASSTDTDIRRWLFRVGYNRAISALRRRQIIHWLPLESVRHLITFEDESAEGQDVRAALAKLSPEDAACLSLIIVHDFTAAEVGQIVGASPQAVAKRFSRAKQRLRDAYLAQNPQLEERGRP